MTLGSWPSLLLIFEAESSSIAKYQRPLLVTVNYFFRDDFFVVYRLKDLIVFHSLQPFLEIAELYFFNIVPSLLEEAVDKKPDAFYSHIAHHHLVGPFVHNRLQIDVVLVHYLGVPLGEVLLDKVYDSANVEMEDGAG